MTDSSDDDDPFLEPPWLTIAPDHPLSQETPGADRFDLGLRVGPIYDILRHPETRTPLAAAIYGDWGAGKTSAMKWLDGRLRIWNEQGPPDGKVTVHSVWFYPWKYQTQEDVWRGLVAQVIIACLDKTNADAKDYMEAAKRLGAFLGDAFIDLVSGVKLSVGLADAAKADLNLESLEKIRENAKQFVRPESAYLNAFESAFETWVAKTLGTNERMVVFIDDLDRCLPEVGLKVLEALKLYLNVEGLVFVVGVDREVVEDLVKKHYADLGLKPEKGASYLAKMFQVEATVAPSDPQIDVFLDSTLSENPAWRAFEEPEQDIFRGVIRRLAAESPREVKRLVNSALMAGAGARMSAAARGAAAEPITPAQGTQVFLVRKVLETPKYTLGSLVGRDRGTAFFTAWSDAARADETPPTIPVSEDFVKQIKAHHQGRSHPGREPGPDRPERAQELERLLAAYPEPYRALLAKPSFADLLQLLGDAALGALMRIPYPEEAAIFGGVAADTTSAGLIREAIARALGIKIEEVTPSVYERVTRLDLRDSEVTDLEPLKGLTNLERLYLTGTEVADLEPLKGLTSLQRLYLRGTQVADLEPLEGLTSLQRLYLQGTQVADLEPLQGLTSLKGLDLEHTRVADLESLKGLTSLKGLDLERTQVADLEPLEGLTSLQRLDLKGPQVSDDAVARLQAALPDLEISR